MFRLSMLFKAVALLLLSFVPAFGQYVRTSDFAPRWQTVAKPARPPVKGDWITNYGQVAAGRWIYPFNPNPRGTFEIRNAIVKDHKVGAWSEPFRFTAKSGWRIKASGHNQKPQYEEDGIVWKITVVDSDPAETHPRWKPGYEQLLTKWDQRAATAAWQWGPFVPPYQWAAVVPYDAVNPRLDELSPFVYDDDCLSLAKLTYGGQYQDVAPPPTVVVSNIPTSIIQAAYCYVTEKGLTQMSDPLDVTVPFYAGTLADTFVLLLALQDETPMGAMGIRWYVRDAAGGRGSWQAVVSPDCHKPVPDANDPNDWIFPVDATFHQLWRVVEGTRVVHTPAINPQSWLCSLQVAMLDQAGDIEVDEDYEISCPIIHNFWTIGMQTTFRGIAAKVGTFKIRVRHSPGTPTYWPVWVNHSAYTQIDGMSIDASDSWCSAALAFNGWGSGSFGNEFDNCRFGIRNSKDGGAMPLDRLTYGMRITWACAGLGGHTASELKFRSCSFGGAVPVYIENPQSANNVFSSTHAISSYSVVDRRYCAVFADTASTQIEFKDDFYCDCTHGGAMFITSGSNLLLTGKIWIDAGFRCLWSITQGNDASLVINGGKFNIRPPAPQRACLVRSVTFNDTRLYLSNIVAQFDPGSSNELYCRSHRHRSMGLYFDKTPLVQNVVLYEPTYEQHEQELNRIYGRPIDGLFPRRPKMENGFDFEYDTLAQTADGLKEVKKTGRIHFNSVQYKQLIDRPNWKN